MEKIQNFTFTKERTLTIKVEKKNGTILQFGNDCQINTISLKVDKVVDTDFPQPVIGIKYRNLGNVCIGFFSNKMARDAAFEKIVKASTFARNPEVVLEYEMFFQKSSFSIEQALEQLEIEVDNLLEKIFKYYNYDVNRMFLEFKLNSLTPKVDIKEELRSIFMDKKTSLSDASEFAKFMTALPSLPYFTIEMANEGLVPYILWYRLLRNIKR